MTMHTLVYDEDCILTAVEEDPRLLTYMLLIAKKKHARALIDANIRDYTMPGKSFAGLRISEMDVGVLRKLLRAEAFKTSQPLVYYSVKHFVRCGSFS